MTVSDNTIVAEGWSEFFSKLVKKILMLQKRWQKSIFEYPGRTLEIGANIASAFASRSPKAALKSLPEVINCY